MLQVTCLEQTHSQTNPAIMKFSWTGCVLWALTCCVEYAAAVASTDTYSDADLAQTGYLPNHNMVRASRLILLSELY
jgi:hypothetical protein